MSTLLEGNLTVTVTPRSCRVVFFGSAVRSRHLTATESQCVGEAYCQWLAARRRPARQIRRLASGRPGDPKLLKVPLSLSGPNFERNSESTCRPPYEEA